MSKRILQFMYLCILSFFGRETPSIQEFRVRRCLYTANSGFTVKRADNDRFVIACDPLESASIPVLPGTTPTESEAALAASDPTETEAVIRGSERDPTLVAGGFAFELQDSVTEEQARHLAQQITTLLSHLRYTPR